MLLRAIIQSICTVFRDFKPCILGESSQINKLFPNHYFVLVHFISANSVQTWAIPWRNLQQYKAIRVAPCYTEMKTFVSPFIKMVMNGDCLGKVYPYARQFLAAEVDSEEPRTGVCLLKSWAITPSLRGDLGGASHSSPYIEVNIISKYLDNLDN